MTSTMPSATFGFVDREEEMSRIREALKVVKTGEGRLLMIRGEAGSGKTRLMQEAAVEAEEQGFSIGFGTALAESVVPYHAWKEVLEGLGLDAILEEAPPPKLLGLYLLDAEGHDLVRVVREGIDDGHLTSSVEILKQYVQGSLDSKKCKWAEGQLAVMQENGNRIVAAGDAGFAVGAVLEGQEDEKFLADLQALVNTTASMSPDLKLDAEQVATEAPFRELLESRKYEGIDYVQDDPKLRQARFFEQVTLGLTRKAGLHAICVVVDDLQWADPSSLALLHYVTRNTHGTSVLLLGTYRIEEAESRPHLRDALKGMEQENLVTEMDLKGLAQHDLAELAESFIGSHSLPDAFLDRLWRETRGNPLFVREVLRGLEEDGAIALKGGVKRLVRPLDQLTLPERVREVIRTRLERLPEEDRRLLDVAATCGTRFTAALISKITGETKGKILNGLNSIAQVHGLLHPADSGFTFDHPAVQEVLYDGVPTETRQIYHKEVAEWLELAGGPVEDIAEHYYRSQDSTKALPHLLQAAENATRQYSNAEAIRFYSEALELETDRCNRVEILKGLGLVHDRIGEYKEAGEWFRQALQLAENKSEKADLLAKVGGIHLSTGEFDEAIRLCNEAMELEGGEQSLVEAGILHILGFVYYEKGEYQQSLEYYEKGVAIAEAVGDLNFVAKGLNNIGSVYGDQGNSDKAMEYYERSLAIRKEIGDQMGIVGSLHNLGVEYATRGDYDHALELHHKSVEVSDRCGNPYLGANFWGIGSVHLHRGEFDEALEYFQKGLERATKSGNPQGRVSALNGIGAVHFDLGDYERALEFYQEALEICERIGHQHYLANNLECIGHVHVDQGEYDVALDYLMRSVSLYEKMGMYWGLSGAYCSIAEAYIGKKDFARAEDSFRSALSSSKEANRTENIARAYRIVGTISREQGLWEEAARNFAESLRIFQSIGEKIDIGRSHYEFGLMWKAKGDTKKAREHLHKAIGHFEDVKLERKLQKAREALLELESPEPEKESPESESMN